MRREAPNSLSLASPGELVVVKVGVQAAVDEEGWAVLLLGGSSKEGGRACRLQTPVRR